ncbi:hypothetical protein HDU67_009231, partial [Dinochytrium kinnereticum]
MAIAAQSVSLNRVKGGQSKANANQTLKRRFVALSVCRSPFTFSSRDSRPPIEVMKALTITMALCALLWAASANAHAVITSPKPRENFSEARQLFPPCGLRQEVGARSDFPISGGTLSLNSFHPSAEVEFQFALGPNPGDGDFVTVRSASLTSSGVHSSPPLDLVAAVQAVDNGSVGTLRFRYNAGDGILYQCSDVVIRGSRQPSPTQPPQTSNPTTPSPNPTQPEPSSPQPSNPTQSTSANIPAPVSSTNIQSSLISSTASRNTASGSGLPTTSSASGSTASAFSTATLPTSGSLSTEVGVPTTTSAPSSASLGA